MIWLGPQNGIMAKMMLLLPGKMCANTQQKSVRLDIVLFVIIIGYLREMEVERERVMDRRTEEERKKRNCRT